MRTRAKVEGNGVKVPSVGDPLVEGSWRIFFIDSLVSKGPGPSREKKKSFYSRAGSSTRSFQVTI